MTHVISFCSSRGGTGKTTLATNLAIFLANYGLDTVAIDVDFKAPSFYHIFKRFLKKPVKKYINDYLDSRCEPQDTLFDIGNKLGTKGRLLIGLSDPSIYAIEEMSARSRNWEAKALRNLLKFGSNISNNFNNPIIIYDNGPGIHYSSLNTIVSSDSVVFVSTFDGLDLLGVANLFKEYEDVFERKARVALNKIFPSKEQWNESIKENYMIHVPKILKDRILTMIPCFCDLLDVEKQSERAMLVLSKHPLGIKIAEISERLGLTD